MTAPPTGSAAVWFDTVDDAASERAEARAESPAVSDAETLALLYGQHNRVVRAFARRLLGDPHHAEDLVHDVFLALPKALRNYRGDASITTLLLSMAVNHAKHHVRGAIRARKMLERFAGQPLAVTSAPDAESERRELCGELQRALDRLPMDQRVVVVLCVVEERTAREVGEIVGAPENTVRTRLFHAMRKLRAIMGEAP